MIQIIELTLYGTPDGTTQNTEATLLLCAKT